MEVSQQRQRIPTVIPVGARVASASSHQVICLGVILLLLGLLLSKRATAIEGGAELTIETASTVSENEPNHVYGLYELALSGKQLFSEKLSGALLLAYQREYTHALEDNSDGDFRDARYKLNYALDPIWGLSSTSVSLGGSMPMSKDSYHKAFQGAVGPGVKGELKWSKLTGGQEFLYRYRFYSYESLGSEIFSPHLLQSSTSVGWDFTEKLNISAVFRWLHYMNFNFIRTSKSWTTLSVGYAFSEHFGLEAGAGTLSGTLSPDGATDRITLMDRDESEVFIDLKITI